jgi:catechol 2,3-dioxygenase-like lactoylglutathione lyase family enzyme
MPRPLDHIDLRVRDLAAAAPFYRALLPALGFTREVFIEDWLQFEAPGDPPAETSGAASAPAAQFFGLTEDPAHQPNATRVAFRADSPARVDQLAALVARLGARHLEGPGLEAPGYYAVFFDDPSGNRLEIVHRAASAP